MRFCKAILLRPTNKCIKLSSSIIIPNVPRKRQTRIKSKYNKNRVMTVRSSSNNKQVVNNNRKTNDTTTPIKPAPPLLLPLTTPKSKNKLLLLFHTTLFFNTYDFLYNIPLLEASYAYTAEFQYMASNANSMVMVEFMLYNFITWMLPMMLVGRLLLKIEWNTIAFQMVVFGLVRAILMHVK